MKYFKVLFILDEEVNYFAKLDDQLIDGSSI